MSESADDPRRIFCDFCKKFRSQAGELRCRHRMCAGCYLDHSKKLDKCYLCILATAQARRNAMEIYNCFEDIESDSVPNEEKFFCTNMDCEFIGNKLESANHRVICNLSKGRVLYRNVSTNPEPSVFVNENTLKSMKFIEVLKDVFDSAVSHARRPLTLSADDIKSLAFDAWRLTEEILGDESTRVGIEVTKVAQARESIVSTKSVMSDCVNQADEIPESLSEQAIPGTISPKYSVEISKFVDTDCTPSVAESFGSDRSTSELVATESNRSAVASEGPEWDLCAEGKPLSSSAARVEDSNDSDQDAEDSEERFEIIDGEDASPEPIEQESQGTVRQGRNQRAGTYRPDLVFTTVCFLALLAIPPVLLSCYLSPESLPKDVPTVNNPGDTDGYITWKMDNVTNLVARAQFNKRDMRLSEFITVRNYEVRLGVGSTFSADENAVILWITAVVMKDDERPWSYEEMQLRLEHDDPTLVQVYDFRTDQKGQWRDQKRTDRKTLIFRQMQIETTKRMKYMRFTNYLTYDDAVAKGYIKDDSISVGFKLMPWGSSV